MINLPKKKESESRENRKGIERFSGKTDSVKYNMKIHGGKDHKIHFT